MASFTGFLATSVNTGFPSGRASFLANGPVVNSFAEAYSANSVLSGGLTNNLPVEQIPKNFTGYLGGSYSDIFYNRILIEPVNIALGNVIAAQNREIKVFNAFFIPQTLTDVTQPIGQGLTLTGLLPPPDRVFTALQERTYTLSVSLIGPPTINADYVFTFLALAPITVSVNGSRIVIIPYYARAPSSESLLFATDVLKSRNGGEQRIKLRDKPRQQFRLKAGLNTDQLNKAKNLFYGWRGRLWALPVWSEARIIATVSEGDTVLNVDTLYGDFRVGGLAMVWASPDNLDVFIIESLTDTTITSERGINGDYLNAVFTPVRNARLLGNPRVNTNGSTGFLQANYEVTDNVSLPTTASAEQFNGNDVFLDEPLATPVFIPDNYVRNVEVIDFTTGLIEIHDPWVDTKINRRFKLVLENLQDAWEFREWLHRRGGRQRPFYMPTFENDIIITSVGTIVSSFTAKNDNISTQATARIHIAFKMTSGSWLLRTILAIVPSGGEITITIDTAINMDRSDIEYVSFMGLQRLTSDKINFRWLANCVAEVIVPITEIEP